MTRPLMITSLVWFVGVAGCSASEASPAVGSAGAAGGGVAGSAADGGDLGGGGYGGVAADDAGGDASEPGDEHEGGTEADGAVEAGSLDTFYGCPVGSYVACVTGYECSAWQYWCASGTTFDYARACSNGACDVAGPEAESRCADQGGVAGRRLTAGPDGGEQCVSCDVPGCKPKGGTCASPPDCCSCRCEKGRCAL